MLVWNRDLKKKTYMKNWPKLQHFTSELSYASKIMISVLNIPKTSQAVSGNYKLSRNEEIRQLYALLSLVTQTQIAPYFVIKLSDTLKLLLFIFKISQNSQEILGYYKLQRNED